MQASQLDRAVVLGRVHRRRALFHGDDDGGSVRQLHAAGAYRGDRPGHQRAGEGRRTASIRWSALEKMPEDTLKRFFLKGTGSKAGSVQVRKELRDMITFRQLNLLEAELADARPVRRDLLPQRDDLFRQEDAVRDTAKDSCRCCARTACCSPATRKAFSMPLTFSGSRKHRVRTSPKRASPGHGLHDEHPGFPGEPRTRMSISTAISIRRRRRSCRANITSPRRDMVLVTVLGSCVAACIRDRISGIGGMNHFMLPESAQEQSDCGQHLGALRQLTRWRC